MSRRRYIAEKWKKLALGILIPGLLVLAGCTAEQPAVQAEQPAGQTEQSVSENAVEAALESSEEEPIPFDGIAAIYVPDSGIVNPPTVIQRVTTGLPEASGRTPAAVLLEIDADLNIIDENGSVISTVDTFMDLCKWTVIPAFIMDSEDECTALSDYLMRNKIQDAFVVADAEQADLVKQVRDTCTLVRGALIFDRLDTDERRKEAQRLVNENKCYVAISEEPLDEYTASYFAARQIAAWSTAENPAGVYRAIANGYAGVIADDPAMVYDVYEGITQTTVSGRPIVIAHRGGHVDTPENTIIGFHAAQEQYGVLAVEVDVRVTTDGVVFLMHDNKVDRTTNGTGKGTLMTWEQLDALVVDEKAEYGADKVTEIPKWEEVLAEFQDSDLVFYCHNKTDYSSEAGAFCRLTQQYDFGGQVIWFTSFHDRSRYHSDNEQMAEGMAFTAANYPQVYAYAKDEPEAVGSFIKQLAPANYQSLFYSYGEKLSTESFYYQMAARGFVNSHSTTNGQETLNQTLLTDLGAVGVLTDDIHLTVDFHYRVKAVDETLKVGEMIGKTKTLEKLAGEEPIECELIQLDGPSLTKTDGEYTLTEPGEVVVVFYADRIAEGGAEYRVYSEPVTIVFAY